MDMPGLCWTWRRRSLVRVSGVNYSKKFSDHVLTLVAPTRFPTHVEPRRPSNGCRPLPRRGTSGQNRRFKGSMCNRLKRRSGGSLGAQHRYGYYKRSSSNGFGQISGRSGGKESHGRQLHALNRHKIALSMTKLQFFVKRQNDFI
jgi:hypothetical protein